MSDIAATPYTVRFIHSIAEIDSARWNALAGATYPFLRHEFLLALESSACVCAKTGWQPLHALVETATAELVACMPLYAKTNSMGEYVFDWAWADAYARHGLEYYPKLLTAIPFTPCAGPRLCIAATVSAELIQTLLLNAVKTLAARLDASSWHVLFPEPELRDTLTTAGLLQRSGCQYQWFNAGYRDFEEFLDTFSSRKRKNLRKERARVREQGISFEILEGPAITPEHWQHFYQFYQSTYLVRGRAPYLNRAFFTQMGSSMPEHLLLILARKDDHYIAGALFLKSGGQSDPERGDEHSDDSDNICDDEINEESSGNNSKAGGTALYGRYWGCTEEFQFLHFETCYYQGIDYCIRHGIGRIDSGAQGEHKIQRGFKPVRTWSSHWIRRPDFSAAIDHFLQEEEQYIADYVARASDYLPFRKDLEL